jgi:hypothetical protein
MTYSASSVFSSALSNSWTTPGGRPALEKGGTFQPTLNEQIAIARSSADEQYDNTYIEQFKGQMQNRLNFLQGQLQQAYTALLSATSAAFVKDSLAPTDNKFLWSATRNNGYQNFQDAFKDIGKDNLPDFDGDGKKEINDGVGTSANGSGNDGIAVSAAETLSSLASGGTVRARAMTANGAAMDIKQKIGVTMRSEEFNDPTLGPITPGFNFKVKEYETQLSTGAYWSGVNYLYAWRPSQMQYTYVDAYSQNSDAAGFNGYLSQGQKTLAGDKGDGSLTQQTNGNAIKWQGAGYGEGYLATYADGSNSTFVSPGKDAADVGVDPTIADDLRFANVYYARTRTIGVDTATWDLKEFAANGGRGSGAAVDGKIVDLTTAGNVRNNKDDGVGLFDVLNGNVKKNYMADYNADGDMNDTGVRETDAGIDINGDGNVAFADGKFDEWSYLPGSGNLDEGFTGNWLGRQHKIEYYNGQAVNGNQNNPIFGNMELARFQTYWDPDQSRNYMEYDANNNGQIDAGEDTDGNGQIDQYLNGVSISALAATKQRAGQNRQFRGPTGNIINEVDARPQDQNSLADFIQEAMRKPMYRDLFRLGLFKDVVINGGTTTPAGGVVNGTLRLSFLMFPDHSQGKVVPGKGYRPGLRGQMIVFQDKFNAKGP